MSNTPSSVRKLTQAEIAQLDGWSFINSYKKYHQDLLDLAKVVYVILSITLNNQPPTQDQFCQLYGDALRSSNLYVEKIAGKKLYLPSSLYHIFADLLAKYVVEQDWDNITHISQA